MSATYHDICSPNIRLIDKSIFTKLFFLLFLSPPFFSSKVQSQSITPYVLNNGGNYSATLEWSIGEGASISPFSSGGLSLNTGVLQPMTSIVTSINEYGPSVFGNQITMGPNPTNNLLRIKTKFSQVGNLSMQLLDAKLAVVISYEAGTIYSSYEKEIFLENYPSGVFYMRVYFKPQNSIAKTGIYKIVKL